MNIIDSINRLSVLMILVFAIFLGAYAQQTDLILTDVTLNPMNINARTSEVKDLNGEMCAVLKIQSPSPVTSVSGNVVGGVEVNGQEYTAHIPKGTKSVKLNFINAPSLTLSFNQWGIYDIAPGVCIGIVIEDAFNLDQFVLLAKGKTLFEKGMREQGVEILERMISVADNDEARFAGLALLVTHYGERNEFAKAYNVCNSAPDSKYKYLILGALQVRNGKVSEGIMNLEKAETMGGVEALDVLFKIYHGEVNPKYKDSAKAAACGMKMASRGNVDAQHFVACCYLSGEGVAANVEEAIEYMTMAASQGKVESQRMLGAIYVIDNYRDLPKARRWLKMAAAQNDTESINLLNQIGWE